MNRDKKQRLAETIASIRLEYGEDILRQLGDSEAGSGVPHLSTGFATLDRALGIGGLPKGYLTQVSGIPTSGAMTLACKALATSEAIVCLDLPGQFDVDYAARCGVDTENLLLIHSSSLEHGLETLTTLVDTASAALFILDTPTRKRRIATATLNRLMSALHRSRCALILLERTGTPLLSEKAAVRLHCQRERWLRKQHEVNGYRTQVRVLKNHFARAGQSVRLTIGFSTTVNGDGA